MNLNLLHQFSYKARDTVAGDFDDDICACAVSAWFYLCRNFVTRNGLINTDFLQDTNIAAVRCCFLSSLAIF